MRYYYWHNQSSLHVIFKTFRLKIINNIAYNNFIWTSTFTIPAIQFVCEKVTISFSAELDTHFNSIHTNIWIFEWNINSPLRFVFCSWIHLDTNVCWIWNLIWWDGIILTGIISIFFILCLLNLHFSASTHLLCNSRWNETAPTFIFRQNKPNSCFTHYYLFPSLLTSLRSLCKCFFSNIQFSFSSCYLLNFSFSLSSHKNLFGCRSSSFPVACQLLMLFVCGHSIVPRNLQQAWAHEF